MRLLFYLFSLHNSNSYSIYYTQVYCNVYKPCTAFLSHHYAKFTPIVKLSPFFCGNSKIKKEAACIAVK